MYNIYAQHGEVMTEDAKIRFLFKKINHSGLESAVEAMKAKITTKLTGTVTYTTVANHISTAVSELPDYLSRNRKVGAVNSGKQNTNGNNSIYNADGTINTGHHPDWISLAPELRKKVNDKRSRLGFGKGKRNNNSSSSYKTTAKKKNQISQLQASNTKHKNTIASLKRAQSQTVDNDTDIEDAGNSFGGKAFGGNAKKSKERN